MRYRQLFSLCFFMMLILVRPAPASVDDLQLAIDESTGLQLRWDNLTGGDEWLAGPLPEKQDQQYRVKLEPGEQLLLLMAADSWLRVVDSHNIDSRWLNTIRLQQSTDGRLFMEQKPRQTNLKDNLLMKPARQAYIAKLENISAESRTLALYASRQFVLSPQLRYKKSIPLDLPTADLQIIPDIGWQQHYIMPAGEKLKFSLQGPTRIAITMRQPMDEVYRHQERSILDIYKGQQKIRSREIYFREDIKHTVRIKGVRKTVSAPETQYLTLPEGAHEISLISASTIYMQIDALDTQYWSSINTPQSILWLHDREAVLRQPSVNMDQYEQALMSQARDNEKTENIPALLNVRHNKPLINKLVQKEQDALLAKIKAQRTGFNAILPVAGSPYKSRWFRYLTDSLKYSKHKPPYYFSQKFFHERLAGIKQDAFYLMDGNGLSFSPVENNTQTDARLLVYDASPGIDKKIYMQLDNGPVKILDLIKNRAEAYVYPAANEAVLHRKPAYTSVLGELAVDRGSLPLIKPASIILPLKPGVKTVRLWQESAKPALWLSLQLRQPLAYKLSESQYLYQLNQNTDAAGEFLLAVNKYKQQQDAGDYTNALINHWLPVFKSWNTAYRSQLENLQLLSANTRDLLSKDKLDVLEQQAREAMQSGQWLLALEYWSDLWPQASGNRQDRALQQLVIALKKTGQHGLSQQLQKAIIFGDFAGDFIYQQLNNMLEAYGLQDKGDARISLAAAFFMHRPENSSLQLLAKVLLDEGRWKQALQLQLLAPDLFSADELLYSALQSGWMRSFDEVLLKSKMEGRQKYKWLALKALLLKQYDDAENYLKKTEKWGEQSLDILLRSKQIQGRLLSSSRQTRESAITQWQALQLEILSSSRSKWRADYSAVNAHDGLTRLRKKEDNVALDYYVMEADKTVELQVAGPAWLRLQMRPLHESSQLTQPLNSRYYIEDGENKRHFLVNNNLVDEHWSLRGKLKEKALAPGKKIHQDVFIGAGVHHIRIGGDNPMLLRLQKKRPYISPSVLPELNINAIAKVLLGDQTSEPVPEKFSFGSQWNSSAIWFDESAIQRELVNIALKMEQANRENRKGFSSLIAKAEKIYFDSGYDIRLSSTMSRIRAHSHWELLDTIDESDGFWVKTFSGWQAESPASRVFQALTPSSASAQDLLINGSSLVLSLFNPGTMPLEIQLKSVSPAFVRTRPVHMSYQLDNHNVTEKFISAENETIKVSVPQGRHSIKFRLLDAPLHHRLWLAVSEHDKQRLELQKSRRYQRASVDQPLLYSVQGPAWLRIDKLYNGMTRSRYQYIEKANTKFNPGLNDKDKNAFYRVFYRTENPPVKSTDMVNKQPDVPAELRLPDTMPETSEALPAIQYLKDEWQLGKQQDGTVSYQLSQISRDLVAGELGGNPDEYIQADISYRHYLPLSERWFYLSALGRYRQDAAGSLGIKSRLRGQFDFIPVDWTLDARLFSQRINGSSEWSAQTQFVLSQYRPINQYFYHLPKLQISRRWLSMENSLGDNIDQDVFSQYKLDHVSSLRLSETLVFSPFQDMQIYLGGDRISNPRWMDIDQIRSRFGWRLLWGNTRWDINARRTDFWSDDDRILASTRRVLQARVLLEKWYRPRLRIELSASLDRDMDTDDKTLRVQLSLHQSEGRGYRDFSPAELLFRDLREARLTPELNNVFD